MSDRDFFQETLPEYRTPRVNAAIYHANPDEPEEAVNVSQWVCTLTNSLDRKDWFHAVKVTYVNGDRDGQSEVHFYLDERDAFLYRASRLGSTGVHLITERAHHRIGNEIRECGLVEELNFEGRSVWEGHTLQEIRNLKG